MAEANLQTHLTHNVADSSTADRAVLGGKGAGLVEMTRMGLRVPPAFVLATQCCAEYLAARRLPPSLQDDIAARVTELESETGKVFGAGPDPLLLSVRSGAPVSMPGMMDTVLNLGLNRDAAVALAELSGDTRFMADVLARFHAMYSEIVLDVLDITASPVDAVLADLGADPEAEDVYDALWQRLQDGLEQAGEDTVPADPREQLLGAIEAVFRSWNTRRAITYRDLHDIAHDMGTAVVVQAMVFGNRDDRSGSGVVFSRNPVTGEPGMYGEYLAASQGEDVVAGTRTPDPVTSLADTQPLLHTELTETVARLEGSLRDVLDIEFTVESGHLYFLQVRSAKRTAPAAVRIATDFLAEGGDEAGPIIGAVTPDHLRSLAQPRFNEEAMAEASRDGRLIAHGTGASPGHVTGRLALTPDRAEEMAATGESVILVRAVTSPTDLHGMIASAGVVTATGGATSHAAVVARALGRTCVVGCADLSFDEQGITVRAGDRLLREGDEISLDGDAGDVYAGHIPVVDQAASGGIEPLAEFCLRVSGAELFLRAASVEEIARARRMGARGVVVAAADLLATHPRFTEVMDELAAHRDENRRYEALADSLTEAFTPLFEEARGLEFGVRAIDFLVDETSELLGSDAVVVEQPHFALPLGAPSLVAAHLRGLDRARARVEGDDAPDVHLSVRNISDAGEAALLRGIAQQSQLISTGAYVSSPRGALHADSIAEQVDRVWVELRLLQAAMFGLPPRLFLTREPLEGYVASGAFPVNPRDVVDDSVGPLLEAVAGASDDGVIGIRITGPVSEKLVRSLYDLGIRRFAVDYAESGPAVLALGKAALAL